MHIDESMNLLLSPNLALTAASLSRSAGGLILKLAMNWNAFVLASRITTTVERKNMFEKRCLVKAQWIFL